MDKITISKIYIPLFEIPLRKQFYCLCGDRITGKTFAIHQSVVARVSTFVDQRVLFISREYGLLNSVVSDTDSEFYFNKSKHEYSHKITGSKITQLSFIHKDNHYVNQQLYFFKPTLIILDDAEESEYEAVLNHCKDNKHINVIFAYNKPPKALLEFSKTYKGDYELIKTNGLNYNPNK